MSDFHYIGSKSRFRMKANIWQCDRKEIAIFGFKNQFDRLMDRGELKMLEHHTSISLSRVKS